MNGAQGRTRTGTGFPTRPSNVRVYQFRHLGRQPVTAKRYEKSYLVGVAGAGAEGVAAGAEPITDPLGRA